MSASTRFRVSRSLLVAAFLAPLAMACGAAEDGVDERFPAPDDDAYVPASEETRRELGIEKWGVKADGPANTALIHGYGARDERLLEVRHVTRIVDDTHVEVDIDLTGKRGAANMRFGLEGKEGATEDESEVVMTMLENTFAGDGATTRVLSRMRADTNADVPISTSPAGTVVGGGSLVTRAITPQDGSLVGNCSELLSSCGVEVVRAGGSAALNSDACAQLVRAEGITLVCRAAGRFIGRLVGGAVGSLVGPVGTVVGGAGGGVAGGALAAEGCRYATGARDSRRECVATATGAAGQTARSSQQCQSIRSTCTGG